MKKKHWLLLSVLILTIALGGIKFFKKVNLHSTYEVGQPIDSLYGVKVYYNGGVDHVEGRNVTADGYNLGLKYQCVEFVKRFYFEYYMHKMPDSYGHAKSFYDPTFLDGTVNTTRDLLQFSNGSNSKPMVGDLLVLGPTLANFYGHVAIVSEVKDNEIELIQQNGGPYTSTRVHIGLKAKDGKWTIKNKRVLGWLRKK